MPGVYELMTERAAALALVELVVEEYGPARLVPCSAQSVRQRLLDDADMLQLHAVEKRIDAIRAGDMR